jgi:hypothetical protein
MNLTDFRSRIHRLEQLVAGLSKELNLWKDCDGPILYVDRLEYTRGIDQAIHGLETARLAMVKVCQRIEESPRGT